MDKKFTERDIDELVRILDYCDRVIGSIKRFGESLETFVEDSDYRDAVKMNLFQVGETSNRLSEQCKTELQDFKWNEMYGMRNIIAHGYEKLDEERVWKTAKEDIPELRNNLYDLLIELGEIEEE